MNWLHGLAVEFAIGMIAAMLVIETKITVYSCSHQQEVQYDYRVTNQSPEEDIRRQPKYLPQNYP